MEILAQVWREACRHIDIESSVTAIAAIVGQALPSRALVVLGIEPDLHAVETRAVGSTRGVATVNAGPRQLSTTVRTRLADWLKRREVVEISSGDEHDWLRQCLPEGIDGGMLVGPLASAGKPLGVVVVVAEAGVPFATTHRELVRQLLEPLAVALENDNRLHELRSLREAAEADRQSLLKRLGRQDVNEELVGAQTGLRDVMDRMELVAKSDVPVLILGETGTGK